MRVWWQLGKFINLTTPILVKLLIIYLNSWGRTESDHKSDRKLKVYLDGRDFGVCKLLHKSANIELVNTQMCAGGVKGEILMKTEIIERLT